MEEYAIRVQNISKMYKLFDKPGDRVKDALGIKKPGLYKEHHALSDVSFDVKPGECVGIIGTNGAGKSTLLKMITGVLNPTGGSISVNGRISALLELGAGFNQEYTGIENIYLNGRMNGFAREEVDARMEDILSFADIGDFVHQPVKTYSSGMFVRLAFAVAINIDPEILIVDEALSVGDIFFQSKCFNKIEEFKKRGKTILFVSHSMGTIQKYCDRAVLLNKGKLVVDSTPKVAIDMFNKMTIMDGREEIATDEIITNSIEDVGNNEFWKSHMTVNPKAIEYGEKQAEIIDFCIINSEGTITNSVHKGEEFTVKVRVKFHQTINNPIIAFTIKDVKGVEMAGANTLLGECDTGVAKEGMIYTASFTQKMPLRCADYLLALGCTGFVNGELNVYHRLYDICYLVVLDEKDTVGLCDMWSDIQLEKI